MGKTCEFALAGIIAHDEQKHYFAVERTCPFRHRVVLHVVAFLLGVQEVVRQASEERVEGLRLPVILT
jgi:hypothetical protein